MLLTAFTGALALSASASAFSDTAPFFLLSTEGFAEAPSQDRIQTSSQVESAAKKFLQSCPTGRYVVVSQPNLHVNDLRAEDAAPSLRASLGQDFPARWIVGDVYGEISAEEMVGYIVDACAAVDRVADVTKAFLPPLPAQGADRAPVLRKNDDEIAAALGSAKPDDCTVIYIASSAAEPELEEPISDELRRRADESPVGSGKKNQTGYDNRPIFEKYHFFGPGLFMALFAVIIFLTILNFSVKTIANLSISYAAFEKDMGPSQQQQKKQQ